MGVGPGDRVTSLRVVGWTTGSFSTTQPIRIGPVQLSPTEHRATPFDVTVRGFDLDWADRAAIGRAVTHVERRLAVTIALAWRAAVDMVAWTDVFAEANGDWFGWASGIVSQGRVIADLAESPPHVEPEDVWNAALDDMGRVAQLFQLGLLARQQLPDGAPLSVAAYSTAIEGVLGSSQSLSAKASRLAARLRSSGWPIDPDPHRSLQQLRSSVVHHAPKDGLPTPDEIGWVEEVAACGLLDQLHLTPNRHPND